MKNLRKIIALFAFIFLAGIFIPVITINSSLNKTALHNETVETQKETLYLLKAENKTI